MRNAESIKSILPTAYPSLVVKVDSRPTGFEGLGRQGSWPTNGESMSDEMNPKAYHTVTPYLVVRDVPRLLKFLAEAFGAVERIRVPRADGSVMHAEVSLGDSIVMMGEPTGDVGPMPASIFLHVDDGCFISISM
jgi:hypothetical protein